MLKDNIQNRQQKNLKLARETENKCNNLNTLICSGD